MQLKIPGLQRVGSRACVSCGGEAESFCARCGVTPYCSARCQRKDWNERHRAVCHNLARLAGGGADVKELADNEPANTSMAPLRRPHSPASQKARNMRRDNDSNTRRDNDNANTRRDNDNANTRRDNDNANQNGDVDRNKKFMPAGQQNKASTARNNAGNSNRGGRANFNRQNDRRPKNEVPQDDDWDNKPAAKPSPSPSPPQPKPEADPQPKPSIPAMAALRQPKAEPKTVSQEAKPAPRQPVSQSISQSAQVDKLASLDDVTPKKKAVVMVPKNYLIELLSTGDTFLLSVESKAEDCESKQAGFVCLSMHETQSQNYNMLCEDYVMHCEAQKERFNPSPGDVFSYLNPEDGGWYRARCLCTNKAALLDSCRVVSLKPDDKCNKLTADYEGIPEFSCVLNAGEAKVGANFQCTIVSKIPEGYKVSLSDVETGASAGEGIVGRWMPIVQYPKSEPTQVTPAQPAIPEVKRPDVVNNSKVIVIDATAHDKVLIRPADAASQRKYDSALADVLVYATSATPLQEPPQKGQTVIGKFTGDGYFYRALCKRTNVKQNKYLLEYIEFGNVEISPLENIYPCPPELNLDSLPTLASVVTLKDVSNVFTAPAIQYIDKLKDAAAELTLTIPTGAKMAPSGSAVNLTVVKNNESVNKKVQDMSTPEWKKIEESVGDVVPIKSYFIQDVEYLEIPSNGCELQILDIGSLGHGSVSGHVKGLPYADYVFNTLSEKMAEYCNSEIGKDPYLPKVEELCIAQCPPYPQWFRAVFLEQESPGSDSVRLCYLDYGNIECVSAKLLRKMMAEFIKDLPVLAALFEIKDFPKEPTQAMLARAIQYLNVDEEGRGVLRIKSAVKQDVGMYLVEAPELVAAMNNV